MSEWLCVRVSVCCCCTRVQMGETVPLSMPHRVRRQSAPPPRPLGGCSLSSLSSQVRDSTETDSHHHARFRRHHCPRPARSRAGRRCRHAPVRPPPPPPLAWPRHRLLLSPRGTHADQRCPGPARRMKLHKLEQPASADLSAQTAHLADKYMGRLARAAQVPFSAGRKAGRYPPSRDDEFRTMLETEQFNEGLAQGGHGVPVSSASSLILLQLRWRESDPEGHRSATTNPLGFIAAHGALELIEPELTPARRPTRSHSSRLRAPPSLHCRLPECAGASAASLVHRQPAC